MSKLLLEGTIEIHAPANRVWTILTDSTLIQQYMFGCVVETSWKQGSPLLWKGAADGHLYVKGDVVAIDAPHRLEYAVQRECHCRSHPRRRLVPSSQLETESKVRFGSRFHSDLLSGRFRNLLASQMPTDAKLVAPHR